MLDVIILGVREATEEELRTGKAKEESLKRNIDYSDVKAVEDENCRLTKDNLSLIEYNAQLKKALRNADKKIAMLKQNNEKLLSVCMQMTDYVEDVIIKMTNFSKYVQKLMSNE